MPDFCGLKMHNLPVQELDDKALLTQIITLSRVLFFLYGDVGVVIDPWRMSQNYGDLLCNEKLQPLIDEAHRRNNSSDMCRDFMTLANAVITQHRCEPNSEAGFINNADHLARHKEIRPHYYGRVVLDAAEPGNPQALLPSRQPEALAAG